MGFALLLAPPALAQTPPGSYLQSCTHGSVSGTTLTASCAALTGQAQDSTLRDFAVCVGDIANFDGTLSCSTRALPEGSYSKSCRFARAVVDEPNHSTLTAACRTARATWNSTQLPAIEQCMAPADIANLNGVLTCKSSEPPPPSSSKTLRLLVLDGNAGKPMVGAGLCKRP